ncbi:hypothetical protein QQP08_017199, partial [Theobroma cacao]
EEEKKLKIQKREKSKAPKSRTERPKTLYQYKHLKKSLFYLLSLSLSLSDSTKIYQLDHAC